MSTLPIPLGLSHIMLLTAHRTHGMGYSTPDFEAIYDKLAKRLWCSKEFVKRTVYIMGYSGDVDVWLEHLVNTEIEAIMQEMS